MNASDVFIGRRAELDAFAAAWEDARGGTPRLLWVEGEAGAGKTAFITRCRAARAGATVLAASGDESETALRYGVVDQLAAGIPGVLARQFPLVAPGRHAGAEPLTVGADLLGALGALPGEEPVLVVVDDVQWADSASVQALLFVLRRLSHDRVVVLVGARAPGPVADTQEPDPRWARLLGPGGGERMRLEGLAPPELSELAAALGRPLGSTGAADRLWRHTGGHPLYARTLIDELPADALAGTGDGLPAPRSLTSVVLARLARAPAGTEALVVAASVLGLTCTLADAAAVGQVADPAVALDHAVGLGLLEERAGPPPARIGFVHPLLRAAVRGDLAPARRRSLHAAAARLLPGRAGLVHRVAAAVGADPGLAAVLEDLASDRGAVPGAEAADLLRAASDLSVTAEDRERRLLAAVQRLLDAGEIARAAALEPSVERVVTGPRRTEMLSQLALLTGRFDRARGLLEAAVADAADASPAASRGLRRPESGSGSGGLPAASRGVGQAESGSASHGTGETRARASANLALLAIFEGDAQRAVALGGAALAAAAGSRSVRDPAGFAVVIGLAATGLGAQARAVLDRAAAAAPGGRAPAEVVMFSGVLAALAADDRPALAELETAMGRARDGEPVRAVAVGLTFLASVRDRLGVAGAVDALELAVATTRDGGTVLPATLARPLAAEALAVRGRLGEARALLREAPDLPRWWGGEMCAAVAGAVVAEIEDDPGGMLRALAPALLPHVRALADGLGFLAPRVLEVEALLAAGRIGEAGVALDALDGVLAGRAATRHAVDAARLRMVLAGGAAVPPAAQLRSVPAPLAVARLDAETGRRLISAGERRRGIDLVRAARARLAELGAVPYVGRCDAVLHAAGLTPPAADDAFGLTPHEQAVAALVARGLTNREVAQELFVTQRTVAYHLSNIYAKLGLASRRQLRDHVAAGR